MKEKFFKLVEFVKILAEAEKKSAALKGKKFTQPNREKFAKWLRAVVVKTEQEKLLIKHYQDMNRLCDAKSIKLLDDELSFFEKKFQPGEHNLSTLIKEENDLFSNNAKHFPKDHIDYEARVNRLPEEIVKYIPGKIKIIKLDWDKKDSL